VTEAADLLVALPLLALLALDLRWGYTRKRQGVRLGHAVCMEHVEPVAWWAGSGWVCPVGGETPRRLVVVHEGKIKEARL